MKKEYIQPVALVKEVEMERVLGDSSILSIDEGGESGSGKLQNIDAETDAMGKQSIWDYTNE